MSPFLDNFLVMREALAAAPDNEQTAHLRALLKLLGNSWFGIQSLGKSREVDSLGTEISTRFRVDATRFGRTRLVSDRRLSKLTEKEKEKGLGLDSPDVIRVSLLGMVRNSEKRTAPPDLLYSVTRQVIMSLPMRCINYVRSFFLQEAPRCQTF